MVTGKLVISLLFLIILIVQFSCSVLSDSLRPHGLQHSRLPCPSPTPRTCSDSCPSSWWCHSTISSSVGPFSSCLQSFPASGSFPVSPFFESVGSNHWSFSFSIRPSNEYSGLISFRIDWFDLLALQGTLNSDRTSCIYTQWLTKRKTFFPTLYCCCCC